MDCYLNSRQSWCHFIQALSEKEAEKAALAERILMLQQDLEAGTLEVERMHRDFLSKQEQDKVNAEQIWGINFIFTVG